MKDPRNKNIVSVLITLNLTVVLKFCNRLCIIGHNSTAYKNGPLVHIEFSFQRFRVDSFWKRGNGIGND